MARLLLVSATVLLAAAGCHALSCYQCSDVTDRLASDESHPLLERVGATRDMPRCTDFDENNPSFKEENCEDLHETCSKVTNPRGEVIRGCFGARDEGCSQSGQFHECFCTGDYCNSAGVTAPALLLLLLPAALLAALGRA